MGHYYLLYKSDLLYKYSEPKLIRIKSCSALDSFNEKLFEIRVDLVWVGLGCESGPQKGLKIGGCQYLCGGHNLLLMV